MKPLEVNVVRAPNKRGRSRFQFIRQWQVVANWTPAASSSGAYEIPRSYELATSTRRRDLEVALRFLGFKETSIKHHWIEIAALSRLAGASEDVRRFDLSTSLKQQLDELEQRHKARKLLRANPKKGKTLQW